MREHEGLRTRFDNKKEQENGYSPQYSRSHPPPAVSLGEDPTVVSRPPTQPPIGLVVV